MTSLPDPEASVRSAFDAAFQRMCDAVTGDARTAELSSLLHHLFRLRELCKKRVTGFYATEMTTESLRAARAATWVRNIDTHELFTVGAPQDAYSDFFTASYDVLVWRPLADLPEQTDRHGHHRDVDYAAE